jgi:uncharacterized membrane protein
MREVDRITSMNVSFGDKLAKMVYIPVWIFGYRYRDKYFKALVNGQTGKISGKKPVSFIKVLIAIGIAVAVIILTVALVAIFKK